MMDYFSKEYFLKERFKDLNRRFFDDKLITPTLHPDKIDPWGMYTPRYDFLFIKDGLFEGDNITLRPGDQYELGRMNFVDGVLLHELVHKYVYEVKKVSFTPDHHDKVFAAECNRISKKQGWQEVFPQPQFRNMTAMNVLDYILLCDQWPVLAVNPDEYYMGAFIR